MYIVDIKTRGKVVRTPSDGVMRTPRRIKVRTKEQLSSLLANLRTQCIFDYDVIEDANSELNKKEASKRFKYTSGDSSISLGGKITGKRGG